MSIDDYDDYDYDAYGDHVGELLRSQSREAVRYHLATVGDAIESRVQRCLSQAENLRQSEFYGPSLVSAASAIELIRFLLVRPLVSGAFLSEDWASLIAVKLAPATLPRIVEFCLRSYHSGDWTSTR